MSTINGIFANAFESSPFNQNSDLEELINQRLNRVKTMEKKTDLVNLQEDLNLIKISEKIKNSGPKERYEEMKN